MVGRGTKDIIFYGESRSAIQPGIEKLSDGVAVTVGPGGKVNSLLCPLPLVHREDNLMRCSWFLLWFSEGCIID